MTGRLFLVKVVIPIKVERYTICPDKPHVLLSPPHHYLNVIILVNPFNQKLTTQSQITSSKTIQYATVMYVSYSVTVTLCVQLSHTNSIKRQIIGMLPENSHIKANLTYEKK